jgi:uncharacterized protein (TIGR02246 family)
MNINHNLILLIVLTLLSAAQTINAQTSESTAAEQAVRKLERAWLDAYEQHDAKAMNEIVAADFVITFPEGARQTKPQILDAIKKPRNPANAEKFYTQEVTARIYGDTVILTGRVVTEYQRNGKTIKDQSLYTDTYVRRNKRWQVVASHLSNVPRPKQPTVAPTAH